MEASKKEGFTSYASDLLFVQKYYGRIKVTVYGPVARLGWARFESCDVICNVRYSSGYNIEPVRFFM